MALSQSLPLSPAPFDDHQCRAYFAGLLPEGKLRRLIAHQCHVSHQNDFALLNAIGGECAGAITVQSADQQARAAYGAGSARSCPPTSSFAAVFRPIHRGPDRAAVGTDRAATPCRGEAAQQYLKAFNKKIDF